MLFSKKTTCWLIFIFIFFILLGLLFSGFVPLWDGKEYYINCLIPATSQKFDLMNFNCFRHPTMLYMLLLAFSQYIFKGGYFFIILTNILLGLLAIYSFYRIICHLDTEKKNYWEKILITAIFAFFPIFTASLLNLNVDYPVLVFFLIFLSTFFEKKYLLAAVSGLFLVFSKETGIILYSLTIILSFFIIRKKTSIKDGEYLKILIIMPLLAFLSYFAYRSLFLGKDAVWSQKGSAIYMLLYLFPYDLRSRFLYTNLFSIFFINFNWIFSLTVLFTLIKNGFNYLFSNRTRKLVFYLLIWATYLLTRYKTFNNLRYFLPLYPLLIIVFYLSFIDLIQKKQRRILVLVFIFLVFLLSNFFAFDPLSIRMYGTFNFGRFKMLKMTSLSGECCGFGRDQLVYNLQYTMFHYLQNKIYSDIKPTTTTYILTRDNVDRYLTMPLEKNNFHRSTDLRNNGSVLPRYMELKKFFELKQKPKSAYFIEYPNFPFDASIYRKMSRQYKVKHYKKYMLLGYEIDVYSLTQP